MSNTILLWLFRLILGRMRYDYYYHSIVPVGVIDKTEIVSPFRPKAMPSFLLCICAGGGGCFSWGVWWCVRRRCGVFFCFRHTRSFFVIFRFFFRFFFPFFCNVFRSLQVVVLFVCVCVRVFFFCRYLCGLFLVCLLSYIFRVASVNLSR